MVPNHIKPLLSQRMLVIVFCESPSSVVRYSKRSISIPKIVPLRNMKAITKKSVANVFLCRNLSIKYSINLFKSKTFYLKYCFKMSTISDLAINKTIDLQELAYHIKNSLTKHHTNSNISSPFNECI